MLKKTQPAVVATSARIANDDLLRISGYALAIAAVGLALSPFAFAGTDTTFNLANTRLQTWIEGSYGLLAALGVVGTGLAMAVIKHNLWFLAAAAGVAIGATVGPNVLAGMFTLTF